MSASESAFSDAEDDPVINAGPSERKRLRSVEDIVNDMEGKKQRFVSPRQAGRANKGNHEFLGEIKKMNDASINGAVESLWERIDRKISTIENKMDKLECQVFERDQVIDELQDEVRLSRERIAGLEDQMEDMEMNSRASNLIFWSEQLGKRSDGERIDDMAVKLINESFPTKTVSKQDFSAIHRLSSQNSVICSFKNKNLRNEIYAERLSLSRRDVTVKGRVFVNESLTKSKREIFSKILDLKKKKVIWTAFTKNGIPCLKLQKDSTPIKLFSMQQLDVVLRRALPAAALPPPSGGRPRGGGGRPAEWLAGCRAPVGSGGVCHRGGVVFFVRLRGGVAGWGVGCPDAVSSAPGGVGAAGRDFADACSSDVSPWLGRQPPGIVLETRASSKVCGAFFVPRRAPSTASPSAVPAAWPGRCCSRGGDPAFGCPRCSASRGFVGCSAAASALRGAVLPP